MVIEIVPKSHSNAQRTKPIEYSIDEISSCWNCFSHPLLEGYPRMKHNKKNISVGKYMYLKYKGVVPKDLCICHTCDNRLCINPDHLWVGTRADNNRDKMEKGRHVGSPGIRNGRAILTEEQVIIIRSMKGQYTAHYIAEMFGVKSVTISKLLQGKTWRHI